MHRKILSGILFVLLLVGISTFVFNIQLVKATDPSADLNDDGKVNMIDVFIVMKAFGSYPSHQRWNATADINEDNEVDLVDLYTVIMNFDIWT